MSNADYRLTALVGSFPPGTRLRLRASGDLPDIGSGRFLAPPMQVDASVQPTRPVTIDSARPHDVDASLVVAAQWDHGAEHVEVLAVEQLPDKRLRAQAPHFSGFGFLIFTSPIDLTAFVTTAIGSVVDAVVESVSGFFDAPYNCPEAKFASNVVDSQQYPTSVNLQVDIVDHPTQPGTVTAEICNKLRFVMHYEVAGAATASGFSLPRSLLDLDLTLKGEAGDPFTIDAEFTNEALVATLALLAVEAASPATGDNPVVEAVFNATTIQAITDAARSCLSTIEAARTSGKADLALDALQCLSQLEGFVQVVIDLAAGRLVASGRPATRLAPWQVNAVLGGQALNRIVAEWMSFGLPKPASFTYRLRCTTGLPCSTRPTTDTRAPSNPSPTPTPTPIPTPTPTPRPTPSPTPTPSATPTPSPTTSPTPAPTPTPNPTPTPTQPTADVRISTGAYHSCALLPGGGARCWGANTYGGLGDGTILPRLTAVPVQGLSGATGVAAGSNATCAVLTDATVRCWGYNGSGQLGHDPYSLSSSTAPVPVAGLSGAVAVSADVNYACALLADGTARCWGSNASGKLGNGTASSGSTTPVAVSGLSGAVSLGTGWSHACAVLRDGTARCWGENLYGQLGAGSPFTPRTTPVVVGGLSGAVAISPGSTHTCALLADGTVRCWGDNGGGQLGDGTLERRFSAVPVVGLSNVVSVSSGDRHTCALLRDGTVRCWGDNGDGQLGDGTLTPRRTQAPVSGLSAAVGISARRNHTCALLADGSARCWGANAFSQLGDGTMTRRTVPVAVLGFP